MLTNLNKNEIVLNNKDTENLLKLSKSIKKGMVKMKQTPSKQAYDQALEVVKSYEKRQAQLQALRETLSIKLNAFENVSFKIDKKKGEVLFAGLLKEQNKTKIGKSVCDKNDKFEDVIGKLIAVKKALGEDIQDVVKLVEPDGHVIYLSNNGITSSSGISGLSIKTHSHY